VPAAGRLGGRTILHSGTGRRTRGEEMRPMRRISRGGTPRMLLGVVLLAPLLASLGAGAAAPAALRRARAKPGRPPPGPPRAPSSRSSRCSRGARRREPQARSTGSSRDTRSPRLTAPGRGRQSTLASLQSSRGSRGRPCGPPPRHRSASRLASIPHTPSCAKTESLDRGSAAATLSCAAGRPLNVQPPPHRASAPAGCRQPSLDGCTWGRRTFTPCAHPRRVDTAQQIRSCAQGDERVDGLPGRPETPPPEEELGGGDSERTGRAEHIPE